MPMSLVGSQIALAWLSTHFIEFLKKQSWFPFARYGAYWLNAITSAVTALVAAGAFTYTFADDGTFTFGGNVYSIAGMVWNAMIQFALQHIFFKTTISPPPTPVLTKADIKEKEKEAEVKS